MGVDYTPKAGFGYQIEFDIDNYDEFDELIDNSIFKLLEVGEGNYTGEDNEWFLVFQKPLEYGLDLAKKKDELDAFIKENNIKTISDFAFHVGLLVN